MALEQEEQEKLTKLQTLFGKLTVEQIQKDLEHNQGILKHLPESDPAHRRFFRETNMLQDYKLLVEKQSSAE